MAIWIALLRGINVGGKNKLRMADLVSELEKIGLRDVKTYIQSGNVIFRAPPQDGANLAAKMVQTIDTAFGFRLPVIAIAKHEFEKAVAANPFPAPPNEASGKTLHFFFLEHRPRKIDRAALDAVKAASESWQVIGRTFYLHAPEGFHTSKLGAKAERILGTSATARNWRTVSKILEMVNTP